LAIDINGDIYPCDYFMQFPEKKLGDIFTGYKPGRKVFEGCDWPHDIFKHCTNCQFGDVQLCTNAMCYAENYKLYGDMLKPSELTCALKRLEFETYTYIATLVRDKGAKGGILDQTVC
jgi:radical SAM protein with 4Fe4S-binding SPASM domain